MKKLFVLIFLLSFVVFGSTVFADVNKSTDLKIRIFPKDCVFDVIEVGGQQQFIFHTPEACGVAPEPQNPSTSSPLSDSQAINLAKLLQQSGDDKTTQNLKEILINELDYTVQDSVSSNTLKLIILWIILTVVLAVIALQILMIYRNIKKQQSENKS